MSEARNTKIISLMKFYHISYAEASILYRTSK